MLDLLVGCLKFRNSFVQISSPFLLRLRTKKESDLVRFFTCTYSFRNMVRFTCVLRQYRKS